VRFLLEDEKGRYGDHLAGPRSQEAILHRAPADAAGFPGESPQVPS
jgi:hypothetical protein